MSFREKSAWICLLITLAVFGPYFVNVFAPLRQGVLRLDLEHVLEAFVGMVFLQVVLSVVFHIALALHARNEPTDERDRAIEAKSIRVAYYVLVTGCFLLGFGVFVLGVLSSVPVLASSLQAYLLMSQLLLFCLVLAETAQYVTQVVSYRRGS
jgi:divalent metal cation (Fe/Co/Zn/Cd) transporter